MKRFGLKYVLREGDPDVPGGAAPVVPEPITFGEDIIPEELKGRPAEEIKLLLGQMPRIVKAQKDEIDRLNTLHIHQAAPVAPVVPAEPEVSFEDLMEADPKAAMRKFVEDEYGGRFAGLETRVGNSEFTRVAAGIPGFEEHADDVQKMLSEAKTPATEANILGAYAMVRGQKEMIREAQLRRDAAAPLPPGQAPVVDPAAAAELNPVEAEVAGAMGLTPEDYRKYATDEPMSLNIRK